MANEKERFIIYCITALRQQQTMDRNRITGDKVRYMLQIRYIYGVMSVIPLLGFFFLFLISFFFRMEFLNFVYVL